MYLKNLTALGFKSFADKTSVDFRPGITAVVGPNGCGKSNIADAIRWVLGEQSAKALRGGEMADVIFNGTDKRKALGLAEVSLTIGDVDQEQLQAAGVELAYNEVTITRRVFRDGGSEYFINKTPCRLKDIQRLFMGTGVGRSSYSIMAQGNITQILSSKPEDRRMIFEEAAGITKFKSQKREALRKLENTEQNLLRVQDLIREVKRQIGSLQRQAGKARRYKQCMEELQVLDTQLARHQYDQLQEELEGRRKKLGQLRESIDQTAEGVSNGEQEIAGLREQLNGLEHEISLAQQKGMELKAEMDRHESRIQFNQERLQELEDQETRANQDIREGEERRLAREEELRDVETRLENATQELEEHRRSVQSRLESVQAVERNLTETQARQRDTQASGYQATRELNQVRNELNALDLQQRGNVVRQEKLSAEKVQLEEERTRLEARLQTFAADVEAEKQAVQNRRLTVEERRQRLREVQEALQTSGQELDGLTRHQAEIRSRLQVLEQLQESHEGFDAGAVAALGDRERILGTLADRIRVPDEHVKAVEVVLGKHLQLVMAQEPETAREVLEELRQGKKGLASIAALGLGGDAGLAGSPPNPLPGEARVLLEVVEAEESVRPLLDRLLGGVLLVSDLAGATRAWQAAPGRYSLVTPEGDILDRAGVYTGGYRNGTGRGAASLLGRKNQIEDLRSQSRALQEKVDEASRRKGGLQAEQTELQAGLQEAQSELSRQEVAVATQEGEFKALQQSLRVLHQKIDTVVYEIQSINEQDHEAREKRAASSRQLTELEERDRLLQETLELIAAEIETCRTQRDAASAELTESKVLLAGQEQSHAALERQRGPLSQRIAEIRQQLEQRRVEVASFAEKREQTQKDSDAARHRIDGVSQERDQVNARAGEMTSRRDAFEKEVSERESSLHEARENLTELRQQRSDVEVKLAERNMALENLRERIEQKYQLQLQEIQPECLVIQEGESGQTRVEILSREDMAATGSETDWEAVKQQVRALQERIEAMGPVNLVAIEEYEETEQRYEFLTGQHDDLANAKQQLMEVLHRINTQTREMFLETFQRIRDNFRGMFEEIFGGGKADLKLVDEANILESGIDIMARPPGKKLQSISLLSGGEQTMTAVALLFAIYQVRPSPFCVLDELDAPLDESNINRFIRILQRFLEHSQFVIITHNKRTIGIADVLYGVTMQEHGVSKIVSVKFHKTGDQKGDRPASPLIARDPRGNQQEEESAEVERESTLEMEPAR